MAVKAADILAEFDKKNTNGKPTADNVLSTFDAVKKKDASGSGSSASPSGTTPTPKTGQPVGTSGSGSNQGFDLRKSIIENLNDSHLSKNQFKSNYKDNSVTPDDVNAVGGDNNGLDPEHIATAINNKGKNLNLWANASSDKKIKDAVDKIKTLNKQIEDQETNTADLPLSQKDYDELKRQRDDAKETVQKSYDTEKEKVLPDIRTTLKANFGNKDWSDIYENPDEAIGEVDASKGIPKELHRKSPLQWNAKTHMLTPESAQWVNSQVDQYLNHKNNTAINAAVSGDLDKKDRTYADMSKSVIDYLNTVVPVEHAQKKYADDFYKAHPEIKEDAVKAQDEFNKFFSKSNVDAANAFVNTWRDKEFIKAGHKYYGREGIFNSDPGYIAIAHKYAERVAAGTMPDDVARKNIDREVEQNPALKKIKDNYENEIKKVNESTQDQWQNYIVNGLKKVDNRLQLRAYKNGSVGLAGINSPTNAKLQKEFEEGYAKIPEQVLGEQAAEYQKQANEKAKRIGPFWASVGSSINEMTSAVSKMIFNKTGWGGDQVRYYESQETSSPQISQSQEAAKWNKEGIESMVSPNFWKAKIGGMIPVIAGTAAIGLATEGEGIPAYVEWLSSAGLFTAQSGLSTYNQLLTSKDEKGNLISEDDASHFMARDMDQNFLPNVAMVMFTSGTLFRAKGIVKPTMAKAALGGLKSAAIAQPFFIWQGSNSYANMKEAKGGKADIWDYMQSPDFRDNLVNGMVIGGGLSLLHAPGVYMKGMKDWTTLIHNSEGEFKANSLYNVALQHEMNGGGNYLRDGLKMHLFNGVTPEEKAGYENVLQYSTNLDRNLKAANLDPKNVHDLYQAHNLALADLHDDLAEKNAANKSLSALYKDKAKDYREQAKAASDGSAKYHYLVNNQGEPIFLSDNSFKALDKEGKIADWIKNGTIEDVRRSDDPKFSEQYKEKQKGDIEAAKPYNPVIDEKDQSTIIEALRTAHSNGQVNGLFGGMLDDHLDNPDAHKELAETLISQAIDHPRLAQKMIGDEAWSKVRDIVNEHKELAAKMPEPGETPENPIEVKLAGEIKVDKEGIEGSPEYKKNIRDDYFAKADFFTPAEKEKFSTLDEAGQDKMIDDKRSELKGGNKNTGSKERQKIIINHLLDSDGDVDGAFKAAGYSNVEGFWIEPGAERQFSQLSPETKEILKKNGVKFIGDATGARDGRVAGAAGNIKYGDSSIRGIHLSDLGETYAGHDHNAIHELGHSIWYDLPKEIKDLFNDGNPISEHGKKVQLGEGEYGKTYGKGGGKEGWQVGEEDFADQFALNKGDLEKTISDKKGQSISSPKIEQDGKNEKAQEAKGRQGDDVKPAGAENIEGAAPPLEPPPPPTPLEPTNQGLHPRDNEWTSIQKKDLSERVQKENAFTQTNKVSVDKVIDRLSRDASRNGRTWQSQAEFDVNTLHDEFFNEDGRIKQAFNPTTEQLALIGLRLMDINGESAVTEFNPNDEQQTARNEYLESEKMKTERLLSFGEAGRAFQFRQSLLKMGINGDIQIKRKAISSLVGMKMPENEEQFNQLSDFDKQKIKPVYDAFQAWKGEYEKENKARNTVDEKYSQQEFEKRVKAEVDKALKGINQPDKITKESSKKISDSLKNFADKFEKFGRADLPEGTQRQGVDFQKHIADAIRWIAEKMANGDFKIPELIAEAIGKFKKDDVKEEDLADHIKSGLKEAGIDDKTLNAPTNRDGILGKMKEIAKNEGANTITRKMVDNGLVRDYLHDIANRGITDPKDILEQASQELSKAFPGLDEKTLRDAYLKEGAYTPDTSKELGDRIKTATQTFHDITVLQRDVEALETGNKLYGADKEQRNTIISDYEKKLREEKEKLIDDRKKADRDIKDQKVKADKLSDYDRRIKDLDNHKKLWDRVKRSDKGVDKDLAAKREELRKAAIRNGVKLESGSKDARETKQKVIEAHNGRVNDLKDKLSDLLNDPTVSDADKKSIRSVKDGLDKMNIKSDAGDLNEKIKKAISSANRLFTDNITNLVAGKKNEVLIGLRDLHTRLKKDNESSLQDIQLDQLKQREITRKEQAERQLASGQFDDLPKLSNYKKDAELLSLTRDRKKAESALAYQVDKYKRQNASFWQRQVERLQRIQRANLISGIATNGKVLIAGVFKPVSDAVVRRTVGTLTTPIFDKLGIKGEREALNTPATIKSFVDSFKGMTIKKSAEIRGNAEKGLETATINIQAANDQLKALEAQYGKDSPEYNSYKDNEYTKANNDYQYAQYDWTASMLYDFISPRAWSERLQILKTGVSPFEEAMGGVKGRTWADEKSRHAAGTIANRAIHTLEIFGRTHGAEKDISARQAFVEGFLKRASDRIKEGEQLTPSKLEGIALQSYPDFLGGKFQNKNPVSDFIKETRAKLENKGIGGKVASAGIGFLSPVLKIPLNIEAAGLFKYTAGLPIAITKTFWEIGKSLRANDLTIVDGIKDFNGTMQAVRDHMESLPAAQRDKIIEYANKGIVGAAMVLVAGSMVASGKLVFGGVYGPGNKKRKYLDADTGEMEELNYGEIALNGHKIGKFWSAVINHLPLFMPAVMGGTFVQKYKDERGDESKEQGSASASFDALGEVVRTAWEESALKSLGDISQAPMNIFNSFTTQMAAKNITEFFDTDEDGNMVKRKPENVWDKILIRTGGRKFVPTEDQYEIDKENKDQEGQQKADDYREDDPYYDKNQK